eukprot:scaffold695_cov113-Cylindrotheca_fusiformis.AAC.6
MVVPQQPQQWSRAPPKMVETPLVEVNTLMVVEEIESSTRTTIRESTNPFACNEEFVNTFLGDVTIPTFGHHEAAPARDIA